MNKKLIIPIVVCTAIAIVVLSKIFGGSNKITLDWQSPPMPDVDNDSIELKVYVENSGSMDGYMCAGSDLKDAVFDYVSDLKRLCTSCSLNYINSKIIPYDGELSAYIKGLTSASFAKAGGDRSNTNLMQIFEAIVREQSPGTVSVFVSDCILDIPESALDYLGNCQVAIKNTFNDAIKANPWLGVEIIKLESKFDGYWYCGHNKELLRDVKRPYYIWVIGDQRYLAEFNRKVPVEGIIGGIKEYCAYATAQCIPFAIEKKYYVVNHTNKITVNVLVDLRGSLQTEGVLENMARYQCAHPAQVQLLSVNKITDPGNLYSHVIALEIDNPATLKEGSITFSYPRLASWVSLSDDTTGRDVSDNLDKTTGLMSLIKGVSEAYKSSTDYGTVAFKLKNK